MENHQDQTKIVDEPVRSTDSTCDPPTACLDDIVESAPPNQQMQQTFGKHHEEIKRRRDASHSESVNPPSFPRAKNDHIVDFSFRIPGQNVALFSVSHVRMPPVSENPRDPAIRIYGVFENAEEAKDHALVVQQFDASVNLQLSPVHEWLCMAASPERLANDQKVQAHVRAVVGKYEETRKNANAEFNDNLENHKAGKGTQKDDSKDLIEQASKAAQELSTSSAPEGSNAKPLKKASRLPRGAEVRDQTCFVVSFLPDSLQALPEPLCLILAAFNTQDEADVYCRNTAGEHVRDLDLYVVSACEWLFPQNIDASKLKSEVFRSAELNSVIANHKSQPQQVETFEKWREDSSAQAPSGGTLV